MKRALLISFLLVLAFILPASAYNLTVSNVGYGQEQDLLLYQSGHLVGQYNTTSVDIPITADTMIVMKPVTASPLSDPGGFLNDAFAYVSANVLPLIILVFLIAMWLGRR